MASSSTSFAILATLLFVSSILGHSQMRCAKYNLVTGECLAGIRNQGVSFESEAYDMSTGNGLCQSPWTNPISQNYNNGSACPDYAPCPVPMGSYLQGETFTIMWLARNHAIDDQTPGNISLYLSPVETENQGTDTAESVFSSNEICKAPFESCNGLNGNFVQCYANCTMPSNTVVGLHTLWWKWAWPGHTQIYSTCSDVYVTSSGSSSPVPPISTPPAPVSVPTPSAPSTTGKVASPSTTGKVAVPVPTPSVPSTTGKVASPSTTGKVAAPSTTGMVSTPVPTPPVSTPTPSSATSTSSSSSSCVSGNMQCLTASSYSTCTNNAWAASQSCPAGTACSPQAPYIYCLPNTLTALPVPTPIPSVPAPVSTPTPVATPTPAPAPSPSTSSTCTVGYQKCTGTGTYSTCSDTRSGPVWAANQQCQVGLSCHPSDTANNIYCY